MKKQKEISIVRSSAAEYLTFLITDVNAIYADENVWLSQKMMGLLYNVESHTVTYHLQKVCKAGELADGKTYDIKHYNLKTIIFVGNKVDSLFAMDDERLKDGVIKDYFEELLQRFREIRLSERCFYQKMTDIYATSIDYDYKADLTRLFSARVPNQLHWAIYGETATEVFCHHADSEKRANCYV